MLRAGPVRHAGAVAATTRRPVAGIVAGTTAANDACFGPPAPPRDAGDAPSRRAPRRVAVRLMAVVLAAVMLVAPLAAGIVALAVVVDASAARGQVPGARTAGAAGVMPAAPLRTPPPLWPTVRIEATAPAVAAAVVAEPVNMQPVEVQPVNVQPVLLRPVSAEPVSAEPVIARPAQPATAVREIDPQRSHPVVRVDLVPVRRAAAGRTVRDAPAAPAVAAPLIAAGSAADPSVRAPGARLAEGLAALRRQDWSAAARACADAVREQPDGAPGWIGLATALERLGDRPAARMAWQQALAILPARGALAGHARQRLWLLAGRDGGTGPARSFTDRVWSAGAGDAATAARGPAP